METPTPVQVTASDPGSAVNWAAILAGAAAAAGITLALLPLGTTLGFAFDAVWNLNANEAVEFTTAAAIWLIVMQWISSFVGGYLAGRLRVRWSHAAQDEVFFRDTAHGLLSWCVATFAVVLIAGGAGAIAPEAAVEATQAVTNDAGADAQKAGMTFSAALSISMFIGALIASVSAVLGGRQRDA